MPFCTKCGSKMQDDDLFCMKCGAKVNPDGAMTDEAPKPAAQVQEAAPSQDPGINKKDLLLLLDRYLNITKELDEIDAYLDKNGSITASQTPPAKHSTIKFFWPWLILTPIMSGLIFTACFIYFIKNMEPVMLYMGCILAGVCFFVMLLVGSISSRNRCVALNAEIDKKFGLANQKAKEVEDKKNRRQMLINERTPMDPMIPKPYRTQSKLSKIISLLKMDQAQTLEEAIGKVK